MSLGEMLEAFACGILVGVAAGGLPAPLRIPVIVLSAIFLTWLWASEKRGSSREAAVQHVA